MTEPRHVNPWIIATSVMFATFMEVLDTTVVNVSLPHIAGSLSVTIDEATWALTSYLVANAIILPMTGWLAGMFGRKRLLMLSVVGFTASSFLCGLAPTLALLIAFRILQGATGGALQPLSQAVLLEAFPPQDRGKAMGFWGLGIVVAPILGPVLGGWLTDTYSWRWVFYINLPVGLASLLMTQLYIFDPPYLRQTTQRIDYWGIGLLAFRAARVAEGLEELLTATLLEPKVALYQSYLGKAYYQSRRFPEGLAALSTATRLDPRDPTPWLTAPEGIRFLQDLGYDELRRANHDLAWRAVQYLSDRWGTPLPIDETAVGCMVSVMTPVSAGATKPDAVRLRDRLLFDHDIEVHVHARGGRVWVRLCAQAYNEFADIEALGRAVAP